MTETLKDLLHDRADRVDFDPVDLGAVTTIGGVRRRRRRAALVGGLAALAVIGAGGVVALTGGDDRTQVTDPSTSPPARTAAVTWITGSTLHRVDPADGSVTEVDLGRTVIAYVTTTTGYVYLDADRRVWTASVSSPQDARQVGSTSSPFPRLVADADGTRVAWAASYGDAAYAVLDRATGEVTRTPYEPSPTRTGGEFDGPYVYALDGTTVIWRQGDAVVEHDLATGHDEVLVESYRGESDVSALEDGLRAGRDPGSEFVRITGAGSSLLLDGTYGSPAGFSPDARWITLDADEPQVFDVTSGERLSFAFPDGYDSESFATGYAWLGDDTLAMIARPREGDPFQVLSCRVDAAPTCAVVVPVLARAEPTDAAEFALPLGEPLD